MENKTNTAALSDFLKGEIAPDQVKDAAKSMNIGEAHLSKLMNWDKDRCEPGDVYPMGPRVIVELSKYFGISCEEVRQMAARVENRGSKLHVFFELSDTYRQQHFAETSEIVDRKQVMDFDMTEATPEQRAVIVESAGMSLEIEILTWEEPKGREDYRSISPSHSARLLNNIPTLADVVDHCKRMTTEKTAVLQKMVINDIAQKTARLQKCLADRMSANYVQIDLAHCWIWIDHEIVDIPINVDTRVYDALRAEYDTFVEERHNEKSRKKEQRKTDKIAWVKVYGSEYLKRALNAGNECSRIYWRERAALEYPGFIVDIENDARWELHPCPSIQMLDLRDGIMKLHQNADVKIISLTAASHDEKHEGSKDIDPCDAIAVKDPLYDDWLVMVSKGSSQLGQNWVPQRNG